MRTGLVSNSEVNTLTDSVLANRKESSFAKIGTIGHPFLWFQEYFYLQVEEFLPANRNCSTCKQKTFCLQAEKVDSKESSKKRNLETHKTKVTLQRLRA